ncbi:MAG: ATP-binding protein [Oscillospiraceae bacterium]|nr:ATP-binding protein [Oscillospiraceae bacterium]
MRIIPKKTRVKMEFFKNIELPDALVGMLGLIIEVFLFTSNIPWRYYAMIIVLFIFGILLVRFEGDRVYNMLLYLMKHYTIRRVFTKGSAKKGFDVKDVVPFTGVVDGFIEYGGEYYGKAIEIPSVEFRFFSERKQDSIIERVMGAVLRQSGGMSINLVKLDRPINFDVCIEAERNKIAELEHSYSNGLFTDDEYKCRVDVIKDRIIQLEHLNKDQQVIKHFYYLVLFDKNKNMLNHQVQSAVGLFNSTEMEARVLNDTELMAFCKYNFNYNFDEREATELTSENCMDWILPEKIELFLRKHICDGVTAHTLRITNYPTYVYNAWGHRLFDIPGTKVVMKFQPLDKFKSVRSIDRAIDELHAQAKETSKTSKVIELQEHIETLTDLLMLLKNDSENLFEVNIFITVYEKTQVAKGQIAAKRSVRRLLSEEGFRSDDVMLRQFEAFVGSGVSAYDPLHKDGRGIHSTSAAAVFPFVHSVLQDPKGILIGRTGNMPIMVDFFKRDNNHVNSNMVIMGKSGSGKSFATKTILANLSAEDSKVFILDPENEYSGIANKLGGKLIDAGNAKTGRLNPFHIVPSVDEEDSDLDGGNDFTSFSAHLQFLEEFFRQILPDISGDAMEMLNTCIMRTYENKKIDGNTDLTSLKPQDFPIFDDLYDNLLATFQSIQSEYGKNNLRTLLTHVSKFAGEGRNARLWNGEATITTSENFVVFNFQTLLANKNHTVANAQMLLILKWLDNEIIKNRDYNIKHKAQRKIIIVIDEAHVFIDPKHPVALDFMFQLAKRIRKYNGMQIVITQNIKDFVGSEEIARKSTAIINASQYSFIFALAPNDMHDLCKLYEKAGAINESEQEEIINNGRGQAFVVTSPANRTHVQIVASQELQELF